MDWFDTQNISLLDHPYVENLADYCLRQKHQIEQEFESADLEEELKYLAVFEASSLKLAEIACGICGIIFDDTTTQDTVQRAVEACSTVAGWDFSTLFYYADNMNFEHEYWTFEDKASFFSSASIYFANQIIENVICAISLSPWNESNLVLKDIYPAINGSSNDLPDYSINQEIEIHSIHSLFKAAYADAKEQEAEWNPEATVEAIPFDKLIFDTKDGTLEIADNWWVEFEQVADLTFIESNQLLVDSEKLLKSIHKGI